MPSVINNPFQQSKITGIHVNFTEFMGKWTARGTVEFKNGLTSGKQGFRADTFDDVVQQIRAFVLELGKNSEDGKG